MSCNVTRNMQQNGVEIRFPHEPSGDVVSQLYRHGFRKARRGHWYVTYTETKHAFALQLCGDGTIEAELTSINDPIDPQARIRKITLAVCDDQLRFPVNVLRMEVEQNKLQVCTAREWNYHAGDYGGDWNGVRESDKVWRDAKLTDVPSQVNTTKSTSWTNRDEDWLQLKRSGRISFKALEFKYKEDVENWDYDVDKAQKEIKDKKEASYRAKFMYEKSSFFVPVNKKAVDGGFVLENQLDKEAELKIENGNPIVAERGGFSYLGEAIVKKYSMVSTSYNLGGGGLVGGERTETPSVSLSIKYPNGYKESIYRVALPTKGFEDDGMPFIAVPHSLQKARSFDHFMFPFRFWDKIIETVGAIENQNGNAQRAKKLDKIAAYERSAKEYEAQLIEMKALFLAWENDNMALSRRFTSESEEEQTFRRYAWQPEQTTETRQGMENLKSAIQSGVRTVAAVPTRIYTPTQTTPSVVAQNVPQTVPIVPVEVELKKSIPEKGDKLVFVKDYRVGRDSFGVGKAIGFRLLNENGIFRVESFNSYHSISADYFGYDVDWLTKEYNRIEAETKEAAERTEAERLAKIEAEQKAIREDKSRALPNLVDFFFEKVKRTEKENVFADWENQKASRLTSDYHIKDILTENLKPYTKGGNSFDHFDRLGRAYQLTVSDYEMYSKDTAFEQQVNDAIFEKLTAEHAINQTLYKSSTDDETDTPSVLDTQIDLPDWLTEEQTDWIEGLLIEGFMLTNQSDSLIEFQKKDVFRRTIMLQPHEDKKLAFVTVTISIFNTTAETKYRFYSHNSKYGIPKTAKTLEEADAIFEELFPTDDGEFTDVETINESQKLTAKRAYERNKDIERILTERGDNPDAYSADMKAYISEFTGYGGLVQFGATGKGILYEYYTPSVVIQKMWALALHHGFKGGNVLEPAAGVGDFLKIAPQTTLPTHFTALELNPLTAQIMRILYPLADVKTQYFEELFIRNNDTVRDKVAQTYDLVIGNPPYGTIRGKAGSRYLEMGERTYTKATAYDEYFIRRGLDLLRPNGLLIYIIGSEVANGGVPFMQRGWTPAKHKIAEKANLLDAYRLPNGIFDRTDVLSDIIVLQKK